MNIFSRLKKPGPIVKIAEPDRPRSEEEHHPVVNLDRVEFLMPEEVMGQNVTVNELSHLVKATEESLRQSLQKIPADLNLRVRFTVYKDRPVGFDLGLNVPIEGTNLPETLQQAYDELNKLEEAKFASREHPVVLCAYFKVNKTG